MTLKLVGLPPPHPPPWCPIHYLTKTVPLPLYCNHYTLGARIEVNLNLITHQISGFITPKSKVPLVSNTLLNKNGPPSLILQSKFKSIES